jgi:hypothetical protein
MSDVQFSREVPDNPTFPPFPFTLPLKRLARLHPDPNTKILKIPNKTEPFTIIFTPFSPPFTRLLTYTQKK